MVLTGYINDQNQPFVSIKVGDGENEKTIEALVDTGFTGQLQLPLAIAVPLGLKLEAVAPFEFGDGNSQMKMLFAGIMSLGSSKKKVSVIVSNLSIPLLGSDILKECQLSVDYINKKFTLSTSD